MRLRYAIGIALILFLPGVALAQATPGTSARMAYNHSYTSSGTTFANLGTACGGGNKAPTPPNCAPQINGSLVWCKDCTNTTSCAGGGSGAWAILNAGSTWGCNVNGVNQASVSGVLTNLTAGAGAISITGNSGNGTDSISGIASINKILYADQFSGADMGAKINAAMAAAPSTGAIIQIPPGSFSFSTTIQGPLTGGPIYTIRGAGRCTNNITTSCTALKYTGSTKAIDQTISIAGDQNSIGMRLQDLTLDGSGASGSASGFSFGGTAYTKMNDMTIQNFPGIGVLVENKSGLFTERYYADNLTLYHNNPTGAEWEWLCDNGCVSSFEHFSLNLVHLNLFSAGGTNVGFKSVSAGTPQALVFDGYINTDGNVEGSGNNDTLFSAGTSGDNFSNDVIIVREECNETHCIPYAVTSGATFSPYLIFTDASGRWTFPAARPAGVDFDGPGGNIQVITGRIRGGIINDTGTPSLSSCGGGSLGANSNSFAGNIQTIPTSCVLTTGTTCPNAVICALQDNTTNGGAKVSAVSNTSITISATNGDTVWYICGCE